MSRLSEGFFNPRIEKCVKSYTGKDFHIQKISGCSTGAMHPVAIVHGENFGVFVKEGGNPFSLDQFRVEAKGLDFLHKNAGVRTPEVIGVEDCDGTALLILEAINEVTPESSGDFARLGEGLARIHMAQSGFCGFDYDTYLGIFIQKNTKKSEWSDFYGECRLRDTMEKAIKADRISAAHCAEIERLIQKLPQLCPPQTSFSLLHGDPWIGNLMYDGKELVAIDCSIYYGNREIDLTTVDFFCPVNKAFFEAYDAAYPIQEGFEQRADLWKINQWLGHVKLFGEKYTDKLMSAVRKYL